MNKSIEASAAEPPEALAWIATALRSNALYYIGAGGVTFMFWWSGLSKLWRLENTEGEMAYFGLHPPMLFALFTIALQLGSSALVVFGGRLAWLGAGALALFTLATVPLAHDFWNLQGKAAFLEAAIVQEHLSIVGGLILAAILARLRWQGTHR